MKNKTLSAVLLIAALTLMAVIPSGCVTGESGETAIATLEEMNDLEYNRWKLYVELGVKIGANRLLEEGAVDETTLDVMASTIETVATKPLQQGATSIIKDVLEQKLQEAGLTNDEAMFILLVAEQELIARGALNGVVNPETGVVQLAPRTKEMLQTVANALRAAGVVTTEEEIMALEMNANFSE